MVIGENFGVDKYGNMYANNAILSGDGEFTGAVHATSGEFTGEINANSGSIGGFNITTIADLATHVFVNSLYTHTSSDGYDYEAGLQSPSSATDLTFYVKRKASTATT